MKKDRELLELAAKAAGYKLGAGVGEYRGSLTLNGKVWDPLNSWSDATKLAEDLCLTFKNYSCDKVIEVCRWYITGAGRVVDYPVDYSKHINFSARRAIVMAAAMIAEGVRVDSEESKEMLNKFDK